MAETSSVLRGISTQLDENDRQLEKLEGGGSSLWRPFCSISLNFLKTHSAFNIYY